jgi:hypothetical protein
MHQVFQKLRMMMVHLRLSKKSDPIEILIQLCDRIRIWIRHPLWWWSVISFLNNQPELSNETSQAGTYSSNTSNAGLKNSNELSYVIIGVFVVVIRAVSSEERHHTFVHIFTSSRISMHFLLH